MVNPSATRTASRLLNIRSSAFVIAVLFLLAIGGVWELYAGGAHRIHLLSVFIALLCLTLIALVALYFTNRTSLEESRLSQESFGIAMAAGKSVAWNLDVKTGQDEWFGDLQTMFGIPADRAQVQLKDFYQYVHPEDRSRVADAVAKARDNCTNYAAEFRIVHKDGTIRWVNATGRFHYTKKGDPLRMVGIAFDITERKKAEEALHHSEAKFSKAFRQGPVAMTLTSARDHRYLDVNETFEQYTGWTRNEAIGRTPFDLKIWFDPERRKELVTRVVSEGSVRNVELRYRRRDGAVGVGLASAELIEIRGEPCLLSAIVDITERKQIEDALRNKESELAQAQHLAHLGNWQFNVKSRSLTWSEELRRIHGLAPGTPEPSYENFANLLTPESWQQLREAMQHAADTGTVRELDLELVRPDGSRVWVSTGGEAVRDAAGDLVCIRGTTQDITERKRAEQRVHESEAMLSAVVDSAMDAIITIDDEQRIVLFNDAAERMFLCSAEEVVGTHVDRFIPPPYRLDYDEHIEQMANHNKAKRSMASLGLFYAVRSNGEAFPIEAAISQVASDGKRFLTAIIRDVTERRRAEEALRDSEQRFRRVVEHIGDAVIADDLEGHITFANDRFLQLFGFTREQLHSLGLENYIAPEYRDQLLDRHRRRIQGENVPSHFEYEGLRTDGSRVRLEVDVVAVTNGDGKIVGTQSAIRDITERRRSEESLRESEERFRRVVEHIGDALAVDNVAGRVVFANDRFLNLFGLKRDEVPNIEFEDYVAPEYCGEIRDRHDRRMRGEDVPTHFEYEGVRRDGTRMWLEAEVVAIRGRDGNLVGSQKTLRDISERKRAERALRESEERLRHLISSSNDWIWEVDLNGVYTYAGPQCRDILGYEPEELIGKSPFELMPPEESVRVAAIFNSLAADRKPFRSLRNVNLHKNGHQVVLETNAVPILDTDGTLRGYRGMDRDITERDRSEQALRESEERFRLVANQAPVMIWMSGTDALCSYFNKPWLDFTGRTPEEELGYGWADGVHAEDLDQCMRRYKEAFARRESFNMQYRLKNRAGEYRWVADLGVPRFNPDGSFTGYIGSCIDITEHKLAEEALATVSRRLIEAHEEERTRIGRELHDDINQRLALLAVELDRWQENTLPKPELQEKVLHAQNRITEIARDVQALSHRLHSSKLEYLGLATAASSFCRELSQQNKIHIDFTHQGIPRNLPQEVSLCLFRVLQEALQNALKYSGVRNFTVDLNGSADSIELRVADTGIGFEEQEAFTRQGLGLISMRERLQLVHGEFSVESKPGMGTTVYARVPLPREDRRAMAG